MTTSHELADRLSGYVVSQLELLARTTLPGLDLPGVLIGHPVGSDVRADLAFTLGLLTDSGVDEVAGQPVERLITRTLSAIDGEATSTFWSYRVAETLHRFGTFDDNAVVAAVGGAVRQQLASACDSSAAVAALEAGALPRNYAAVLARCELARHRLGLLGDTTSLERLLAETSAMLAENPLGYVDDSPLRIGRYDIYTADLPLFTEGFADRLGPGWRRTAKAALELVEMVGAADGTAIPWGRSTGALGVCLTIELAALATRERIVRNPGPWITRAASALDAFEPWMDGGLISSHRGRSTYGYRGIHRLVQMTFDCLGKLAWSAGALRAAPEVEASPRREMPLDVWIPFDQDSRGVWSYRSPSSRFVLPVVGATRSDYLPALRNPGSHEVPVDSELATGVPVVFSGGRRYTVGGGPHAVGKSFGHFEVRNRGFPRAGHLDLDPAASVLPGTRRATYRVEGRTVHVSEQLVFEQAPDAVAIQVTEAERRPLRMTWDADVPFVATTVETGGMKDYRSFWGELPRVHQVDLEPAVQMRVEWSITPKLRVASTAWDHHYHRSLYDPIAEWVHEGQASRSRAGDEKWWAPWDVLHLHWPEWFLGSDLARNRAAIDALERAGVRVVWTQHNLTPHSRDPEMDVVYQLWASVADAALHHSAWGMEQVRSRYRFADACRHVVLPHGQFANLVDDPPSRREAEAELGLRSGVLRLGVVGAPRPEKDVQLVMDAVAASERDDIELVVLSLAGDETVPDDPRIRAEPYRFVDRAAYDRWLATIDVVVLPFLGGQLLTTGTVGDVVAWGRPALTTDWPFLVEALGDGAIVFGRTAAELTATIEGLTADRLDAAATACRALRRRYDWTELARQHLEVLESVGTAKP